MALWVKKIFSGRSEKCKGVKMVLNTFKLPKNEPKGTICAKNPLFDYFDVNFSGVSWG